MVSFLAAEGLCRRNEALARMRRDPAVVELNASIDELIVQQLRAEDIAAAAGTATELGSGIHERLMAVDLRIVAAGEHGGPAGVIRMIVRVDDRADGPHQPSAESFNDCAAIDRVSRGINDARSVLSPDENHVARGVADRGKYAVRDLDDVLPKFHRTGAEFLSTSELALDGDGHLRSDRRSNCHRYSPMAVPRARHRASVESNRHGVWLSRCAHLPP